MCLRQVTLYNLVYNISWRLLKTICDLRVSSMRAVSSLDGWSIKSRLLRYFDCFGPTPYYSGPLPVPRYCLLLDSFSSQGFLLEGVGHVIVTWCDCLQHPSHPLIVHSHPTATPPTLPSAAALWSLRPSPSYPKWLLWRSWAESVAGQGRKRKHFLCSIWLDEHLLSLHMHPIYNGPKLCCILRCVPYS